MKSVLQKIDNILKTNSIDKKDLISIQKELEVYSEKYFLYKKRAMIDERTGAYRYYRKEISMFIDQCMELQLEDLHYVRVDLNYFSEYNKRESHQKGDILLNELVLFLNGIKEIHRVYRYGGDEFDMIVSTGDIESWSKILKQKWRETREIDFSIGYVKLDKKLKEDFNLILEKCDDILFEDKL